MVRPREVQVGAYFEKLASDRRLGMVAECSALLRQRVDALRLSPLSQFEPLAEFDLYAGDGHYLEAATHDPMQGETHWPTGHFFALNLKSQSLFPLVLADQVERKKEHDLRALKRQSVAMLRQGAGKGRKVLWVTMLHGQHDTVGMTSADRGQKVERFLGHLIRSDAELLAQCAPPKTRTLRQHHNENVQPGKLGYSVSL